VCVRACVCVCACVCVRVCVRVGVRFLRKRFVCSLVPSTKRGPTGIWTRIAGFKVQSDNHYTIGPTWRIGASIPVPRACKARTLPIELIPHVYSHCVCLCLVLKTKISTRSHYRLWCKLFNERLYAWTEVLPVPIGLWSVTLDLWQFCHVPSLLTIRWVCVHFKSSCRHRCFRGVWNVRGVQEGRTASRPETEQGKVFAELSEGTAQMRTQTQITGREFFRCKLESDWRVYFLYCLVQSCDLSWQKENQCVKVKNRENKKHTAPTIPVWSPTTVLGRPNPAWLQSSDGIWYIQGGMTVWYSWLFSITLKPNPCLEPNHVRKRVWFFLYQK
jgi:hypothetical protein